MRIKWGNIFALGILICLIILLTRLDEIADGIYINIDIARYFENPMTILAFFSLICLTIIAVAKIISDR